MKSSFLVSTWWNIFEVNKKIIIHRSRRLLVTFERDSLRAKQRSHKRISYKKNETLYKNRCRRKYYLLQKSPELKTIFSVEEMTQKSFIISWIELLMLLSCCLIHLSIIILRHFLYLLYLYPCLDLGLFMSYLCNIFFIFFMINRIMELPWSHEYRHTRSFAYFSEYVLLFLDNDVKEECE